MRFATIDPAGLLLFAVTLDDLSLSDGMSAYGEAKDPLLPVGELTRLLEMDVTVQPSDRRIVGSLGEARRSLLVDLDAGVARIGAKDIALKDGDVAITATEIYLRASAVEALLPLHLAIRPDDLSIKITATERLPIQARMQRKSMSALNEQHAASQQTPTLEIATPYRLFSPPSADVVLSTGVSSTKPTLPFRYDLRLAGDLLYSDFQAYLSSDQHGQPSTARFLLERRSVTGDLFGPLHGRDLMLGDVYTPGLTLGPRSVGGRGFSFSTVPIDQSNVFNRIDLRGELPVGYDVEIYVNDVLRGSQSGPNDGRYEFLNVPLTPGVNVIRTVIYGPRGERREETRIINEGAGLLHKGEATFEFGAVQQDVPLLTLQPGSTTSLDPGAINNGGLRVVGALNYGVTSFLTASAGAAVTPADSLAPLGDPRRVDPTGIYTVGARTSILGLASQADIAGDNHRGRAADLSIAGSYKGVSAVLRHAEYQNGFRDENNLGADPSLNPKSRTEFTTDANLGLRGRIIPVSLRVTEDEYTNGGRDLDATWRASASIGRLLYSGGFEYQRAETRVASPTETLTGYLAASTYAGFSWQIRAALDYNLLPVFRANTLNVTADHAFSDRWSIHLSVGEPLQDLTGTALAIGGIYHTRRGDFSLTGDYSNADRSWEIAAQWNFGIGYDPWRHGYSLTTSGPGSGGSAVVDAFIDENGDGVHEPGEPAAPNLVVHGGRGEVVTGADGRAYVTGLGVPTTARLEMNLDRLDNPSVKAPPTAVQFSPRQGGVARIAYPLQPTGGVTVIIELQRDDGKRVGLSSVKVQLVPEHGAPIEQTTEFDGSAIFDQIRVGTYHLQLDAEQAKQLRMHLVGAPPAITIKDDGGFTPDAKAQVKFDPAPDVQQAQMATN